ncbi:hypothetical protein ABFS83_04G196000 [Erythranthe nasuta]
MEIVEDGSATTMPTAVAVKEKYKKLKKLTIDDYLDFIDGRTHHHHLTVPQLLQILSMHGYIKSSAQKSVLIDMITTMELMDLHRSTLLDGVVSGDDDAAFTMEEAIKDLKDLDWLECHVTSLLTQGGVASAAAIEGRAVSGNKVAIDDCAVSAGTTVAAGSATVSLERKITKTLGKKKKKKASDDSAVSAGTTVAAEGTTVSVKPKKSKTKKASGVAVDDSAVFAGTIVAVDDSAVFAGTIVAAEGTTVAVKPKKSKTLGKKASKVAVDNSAVSAGTTVAAEGTTVAVKQKKSKTLGEKASEAAVNDSIVSDGTTIDAGSTTFTAKPETPKAIEAAVNDSAVSDGTTIDAGSTTTFSETPKTPKTLEKKASEVTVDDSVVPDGTTVAAGSTTERLIGTVSLKRQRSERSTAYGGTSVSAGCTSNCYGCTAVPVKRKTPKGLGMKTIHVGAGTTVAAGGTTQS